MLQIKIPKRNGWDERVEQFVDVEGATLQLEHSLISLSRWEAIWHKPFLSMAEESRSNIPTSTTEEEFMSYVKCMVMNQNFDPDLLNFLTVEDKKKIREYIEDPMTATWFSKDPRKHGKQGVGGPVMTSEYIYYLMIDCGIPKEMEKWHLNRLMTLIRLIKEKERSGNKKQRQNDVYSRYAAMKARTRMPK